MKEVRNQKSETRSQRAGAFRLSFFVLCLLTSAICLLFSSLSYAVNFTASVDRTEVSVGEQIQLSLRCEDMASIGQPNLPQLDGFNITYGGAQTQVSIENGVRHDAVTHIFLLTPTREGVLVIPAFKVQVGNQECGSQAIVIKVVKGQVQGINTEDLFQMKLSVTRTNLFLNEMVPVDLKLFIRNGIRYRSQMPSIAATGFSEIKLPRPVESQEVKDGKSFVVYTFRTLACPIQLGQMALGPAQAALDVFVNSGRPSAVARLQRCVFRKLLWRRRRNEENYRDFAADAGARVASARCRQTSGLHGRGWPLRA